MGELAQASQVKLLRVLQEREYYPLGSDTAMRTDARVICASNADFDTLQAAGRFRKDLYHRLKTHHVHIPPLRERLDDIPFLVDHLLEKAAAALGKKKPVPPKELYALLATYAFPGNVRELESMIFDAVSHHESRMLSMSVFEARIRRELETRPVPAAQTETSPYALFSRLPSLKESAAMLTAEALRRAQGNQTIAARMLGISRTGLNKRVNQHEE
jgi:DNA-binding NtrC family response regulator